MIRLEADYHGGFAWAPTPASGVLILDQESVKLIDEWKTAFGDRSQTFVQIGTSAIESVEVTSQQAAKSRVGAVLVFGVLGGLAARGSEDRGTLLIHLRNGQTGYFTIGGYSESQLLGKLTPWLHALNIRVGSPAAKAPTSMVDELAKLAELRSQGVLTDEEFATAKAKLLA